MDIAHIVGRHDALDTEKGSVNNRPSETEEGGENNHPSGAEVGSGNNKHPPGGYRVPQKRAVEVHRRKRICLG